MTKNFQNYLHISEKFCYSNLLLGSLTVIIGAFLLNANSKLKGFGDIYEDCGLLYILLIIAGSFLVLLGLLGVYAQKKLKNFAMTVYNVGIIVLTLLVGFSLILSLLLNSQLILYEDDSECNSDDLMIEIKITYESSKKLLCSPLCPCNANKSNFQTQVYSQFAISLHGANKLDECYNYIDQIEINFPISSDESHINNYVRLLKHSEESFSCSGFCKTNSYYVFRNINDGTPNLGRDCKEELIDYIQGQILVDIIARTMLSAYLLTVTYFCIKIMLSQKKANNGKYYNNQNNQNTHEIPNQNTSKNIQKANEVQNAHEMELKTPNKINVDNISINICNTKNNNNQSISIIH